jgi:hypothetical protein
VLKLVQRGQSVGEVGLEVREDVVLDKAEAMPARQLQQPECHRRRQRRPGRVLQHAVGEEQLGLVLAQQRLGGVRVGAVGRVRHAHQLHPMQPQQAEQVVVAGIFHEHRIAGLEQVAHHQVQRLAGTGGDQHLRQFGGDAQLAHAQQHLAAQFRMPHRRGVVDHAVDLVARDRADRLRQPLNVAPGFRHKAAGQLERAAGVVELLEDVVGKILGQARIRPAAR